MHIERQTGTKSSKHHWKQTWKNITYFINTLLTKMTITGTIYRNWKQKEEKKELYKLKKTDLDEEEDKQFPINILLFHS